MYRINDLIVESSLKFYEIETSLLSNIISNHIVNYHIF